MVRGHFWKPAFIALACVIAATAGRTRIDSQELVPCSRPLVLDDLRELLDGGVPETRIRQFVEACGTVFTLSPDAERPLRERGATDALIALLAPPRKPVRGNRWVSPIDQREMVWIAGGRFEMGSPLGERGREPDEQAHPQTVGGFWLDTTEVTYNSFRKFLVANPE